MSVENSVENENLSQQLAAAKAELRVLRKKQDKVGITFKKYPEAGEAQILRKGYIPYLTRVDNYCVVKDEPQCGEHVLIEGDNISALVALQATHKGKIDVIYIDPPYNTGNNDFVYNDRYVSNEDGFRHSKWLSFMERRLHLAKELLSETGVIFVSIDDNEQATLKMLMDSEFGADNFVTNLIWTGSVGGNDSKDINVKHEYVVFYAKNKQSVSLGREFLSSSLPYPHTSSSGRQYREQLLRKWGSNSLRTDRPNLFYPIEAPDGTLVHPMHPDKTEGCWRWGKSRMDSAIASDRVSFKKKNGFWVAYEIMWEDESQSRTSPYGSMLNEHKTTAAGSILVRSILGKDKFSYPKPVELIEHLLKMCRDNPSAIVLDFFAGSGTTGHAVAALNAEDGGNRQAILVTNNFEQDGSPNGIARDVTAARMKAVLTGIWADGKARDALPGNLHYYKIDFKKPVANMMNNAQIMQSKFTGLAALATGVHITAKAEEIHLSLAHLRDAIQNNQCSLLSSEDSFVVVWKDYEELLDNEELVQLVLNDITLISGAESKSKVLYVPFDTESIEDDFSFPGWDIVSFPVAFIKIVNNVVSELIDSYLLSELVEIDDDTGNEGGESVVTPALNA